jgi:4-amino-4-deoxy-L-arabinose transferase-like glycosyltransferase
VVRLSVGPSRWDGRGEVGVTLYDGRQALAAFAAPDQVRHYHAALAPSATTLTLQAPVERPPAGEKRWLGVTLYGLEAQASGLPLRAAAQAAVPAAALVLVAIGLVATARRGHAIIAVLMLLALGVRVVLLRVTPPGFRPDEVVSLVDAWNIALTGRDHLGNLLPLGAQEAFGDWISPLLTYLELPAVALFGPEPLVGRLITALVGTLAAPLLYVLARALGLPKPAAFCAGLVAALSPWQIFMSRIALPPALVPTFWTLCLLAGLLLIQRGGRGEALLLALIAGTALYAYPTLKLAVPLLVAWAAALALLRHGWGAAWRWLPAAPLLALLWLPFAYVTLFNPASSTRLSQAAIQAGSWREWLAAWWSGYTVYFRPDFYYWSGDGSSIRGVPGYGAELLAGAPLVLVGLIMLVWRGIADCRLQIGAWRAASNQAAISNPQPRLTWLFVLGALLLAPLPASLTQPSPHAYRAATIAPLYALAAGLGTATLFQLLARVRRDQLRRATQGAFAVLLSAALVWQAGAWFSSYVQNYPPRQAWANQDGLLDAMKRAIAHTAGFDEVWVSYTSVNVPYIYLLAAQPLPPHEAKRLIQVTRVPGYFNDVTSIGRYRFVSAADLPRDLPALEAIPDRYGEAAFLIQAWQQQSKRILIVRRME